MSSTNIVFSLIASTIRLSTPLTLAALGGLYCERSGVINMALEGTMLAGAFTAATITYQTGSPWLGLLAAIISGLFIATIQAFCCIKCNANQVVVGTAMNILMLGAPALISGALFDVTGSTPALSNKQTIPTAPIIIAFTMVFLTHYIIYKTRFGLRLRSTGETPEATDTAGINVNLMRYKCMLISGALAAIGGAYLSIGQNSLYTRNMTSGRGYIALAALIFGNWMPVKTFLACLLFGFTDAVQIRLQGVVLGGITIPTQLIQMIPYVFTIVVLAGFIGKAIPPKALGKPYLKGHR